MGTLTAPASAGESLIKEATFDRSRAAITVKAGASVGACSIIAAILSGTATSAVKASGANTGNSTLVLDAAVPIVARAQEGIYTVRFTTTTNLRLENPKGVLLGDFTIGGSTGNSVTINEQIKAVVTQGATPFAAGDGFDITISAITAKCVPWNPAATDGAQDIYGIAYGAVDAPDFSDKPGVAWVADCEHNADIVVWPAGISAANKAIGIAQLAERGIILR